MGKQTKQAKKPFNRVVCDECTVLPKAKGNGQLIRRISVGADNVVTRYSLAYINHNVCGVDNGRALGYDNAHDYHHRHYMGKVEPIEFISFEQVEQQFQQDFEVLYAKIKK
jgi:hypothetical protein